MSARGRAGTSNCFRHGVGPRAAWGRAGANAAAGLGVATEPNANALALLRGAYHLYQGIGPGVGNALMGVVFALVFLRVRRVMPLVIAHALLDAVGFVGYPLLARAGLLG